MSLVWAGISRARIKIRWYGAFPATRPEFVVLVSTRAMHPFPPCLYIELGAPLEGICS